VPRGLSRPFERIDETPAAETAPALEAPRVTDYAVLLKPRVMSLVVFTGVVGLVLAPGAIDAWTAAAAVLFIAMGAGASGAINMWYDRDIDGHMRRTRNRPLPAGRMAPARALAIGIVLAIASVVGMSLFVNPMAALLLAITIAFYVFVYTIWLKRRTPQNIVIGGASGALPPAIGWAAVSGDIGLGAAVLFAIVFLWTPPHFWALALYRCADYANAGVPMLPVVSGDRETRRQIAVYSVVLVPVTLLPVFIGMSGLVYGVAAALLGLGLLHHAHRVWRDTDEKAARPMFLYSILYLSLIFLFLLVDRAVAGLI
jgi:protoheme IX farnesyltransferase